LRYFIVYSLQQFEILRRNKWEWQNAHTVFLLSFAYFVDLFVCLLITKFGWFHVGLLNRNMSTIDTFYYKDHPNEKHKFDLGKELNWRLVFGNNKLLWLLPLQLQSGKPQGDGVYWVVNE